MGKKPARPSEDDAADKLDAGGMETCGVGRLINPSTNQHASMRIRGVGFAVNQNSENIAAEEALRFVWRSHFFDLGPHLALSVPPSLLPVQMVYRLLLVSMVLAGCGPQGRSDLIPVSGSVLQGDQPLTTGSVSFRPDSAKNNRSLDHPTGVIDPSGRYQLYTTGMPGAPPGWYKVVVNATERTDDSGQASPGMPKSIIDPRYNSPATSPLAIEVKSNAPDGHYELRLDK